MGYRREKLRGLYLYCSADPLVQQRQVAKGRRQILERDILLEGVRLDYQFTIHTL
jgi:hypothetical protein